MEFEVLRRRLKRAADEADVSASLRLVSTRSARFCPCSRSPQPSSTLPQLTRIHNPPHFPFHQSPRQAGSSRYLFPFLPDLLLARRHKPGSAFICLLAWSSKTSPAQKQGSAERGGTGFGGGVGMGWLVFLFSCSFELACLKVSVLLVSFSGPYLDCTLSRLVGMESALYRSFAPVGHR